MKRTLHSKGFRLLLTLALLLPLMGPIADAQQQADEKEKAESPAAPKSDGADTNSTATNKPDSHAGISISIGSDKVNVEVTNLDEIVDKKLARHLKRHFHSGTNGQPEVAVGQPVTIEEGKTVDAAVSVFGGLEINGTVTDSAVSILGPVTLGPKAVIEGELVVVGGDITADPDAKTGDEVVVVGGKINAKPGAEIWKSHPKVIGGPNFPHFEGLQHYFHSGVMKFRPFAPDIWWVWCIAGVFFLIHLAVVVLFPRPVQACVTVLEERPITAFFSGLLLLILLAPVVFLLCVSMVGILVIPFFVVGLLASLVFGKVAVYRFTGQQVGRQFHSTLLQAPLMALVIGTAIFYLFYMIPILGILTFKFLTVLGLGTALLAIVGGMKRESKVAPVPGSAGGPARTAAFAGAGMAGNDPGAAVDPNAPGAMPGVPSMPPIEDATSYPRVGFWRRLFASFLDFIMLVVISQGIFHSGLVMILLMFAYHVAMWGWKGTTIGGVIMGIKIYRIDGRPIDYPVAAVRSLASMLSFFVMCIGFFWAGWSSEKRSWHDLIAGTMVVRTPTGVSLI